MAKIDGVYVNWSGKLGNTVFCNWKSKQVLRSKNIPFNPKSADQIVVRNKIKFLAERFSCLSDSWIKRYWDSIAKQNRSGWNEFFSQNFSRLDDIKPDEVILSKGNLLPVVQLKASYTPASGVLSLTWTNNSYSVDDDTDSSHKTLFDDEDVQFDSIGGSVRPDGEEEINLPADLDCTNWYLFFCFENTAITSRGNKIVCSNSVCIKVSEVIA